MSSSVPCNDVLMTHFNTSTHDRSTPAQRGQHMHEMHLTRKQRVRYWPPLFSTVCLCGSWLRAKVTRDDTGMLSRRERFLSKG